MIGYRYFVVKDTYSCGFLTALEDVFGSDVDTILNLCAIFEDKLSLPELSMSDTKSYFTKKGNRVFHKAILKCKKAYEERGYSFKCIICELDEDLILYKDELQIVALDYACIA